MIALRACPPHVFDSLPFHDSLCLNLHARRQLRVRQNANITTVALRNLTEERTYRRRRDDYIALIAHCNYLSKPVADIADALRWQIHLGAMFTVGYRALNHLFNRRVHEISR